MTEAAAALVRRATPADARPLIQLLEHLSVETDFLVVTVPHIRRDLTAVVDYLRVAEVSETNATFVAEIAGKLVGMLVTSSDPHPAKIGVMEVDLGVRLDWRRQGVGRALMQAAEELALGRGAHRIQLRVMTHNAPAIALYKSMGYEIEGTLRRHLIIKGQLIDQHVMAKLLA